MVEWHPFVTSGGTWKEANKVLEELRRRQIRNHLSLARADSELKEKVKTVLKDINIALGKIQEEIRGNVDLPGAAFSQKKFSELRTRQAQLRRIQDKLLDVVGK